MTKTCLYRFFDAEGTLLYIGISFSVARRFSEHKKRAWFGSAATITIEWFDTKREALDAEKAAIRKENPLHNVAWAGSAEPPAHYPKITLTWTDAAIALVEEREGPEVAAELRANPSVQH